VQGVFRRRQIPTMRYNRAGHAAVCRCGICNRNHIVTSNDLHGANAAIAASNSNSLTRSSAGTAMQHTPQPAYIRPENRSLEERNSDGIA
jgi:hypothetical protein